MRRLVLTFGAAIVVASGLAHAQDSLSTGTGELLIIDDSTAQIGDSSHLSDAQSEAVGLAPASTKKGTGPAAARAVPANNYVNRMPLREIDRTVFLPRGSWAANQYGFGSFVHTFEGRNTVSPVWLLGGLFPMPPSYTTKKGWYFPAIALPVVVGRTLREEIDSSDGTWKARGTSWAILGGLAGFSYSTLYKFNVTAAFSVLSKSRFSSRAWVEWSVPLVLDTRLNFTCSPQLGVGIQATNKCALVPRVSVSAYLPHEYQHLYLSGTFHLVTRCNINRNIGISVDPGVRISETALTGLLSYTLNFYW